MLSTPDELNVAYAALPPVFQRRIERFRAGNPKFRQLYETYEVFCCEQALVLVNEVGSQEALKSFLHLSEDDRRALVPGWSEEHTNNTLGCSVALASGYLTDPEMVVNMHGALVALVGCAEYGCTHHQGGLQ
jgi:hypothetical protein